MPFVHRCLGIGFGRAVTGLMHPDSPKKEEELVEHVEIWHVKMRGLEAHGNEYKLTPAIKLNALRMIMTGKAKE